MFIARISRGRTIKEVILYSLTGPLIFAIVWFSVFGGAAIQMENQAQLLWKAGQELYNDPSYFQAGQGSNKAHTFSGVSEIYTKHTKHMLVLLFNVTGSITTTLYKDRFESRK
jgi:hypothetical protein